VLNFAGYGQSRPEKSWTVPSLNHGFYINYIVTMLIQCTRVRNLKIFVSDSTPAVADEYTPIVDIPFCITNCRFLLAIVFGA